MTYRTLCTFALALLFVAAAGCKKDDHGHAHGEGADHAHDEEKVPSDPPTRTETVPAANTGAPVASDASVVDEAKDQDDTTEEPPADDHAKGGHDHDKKGGHTHGDEAHKH